MEVRRLACTHGVMGAGGLRLLPSTLPAKTVDCLVGTHSVQLCPGSMKMQVTKWKLLPWKHCPGLRLAPVHDLMGPFMTRECNHK